MLSILSLTAIDIASIRIATDIVNQMGYKASLSLLYKYNALLLNSSISQCTAAVFAVQFQASTLLHNVSIVSAFNRHTFI